MRAYTLNRLVGFDSITSLSSYKKVVKCMISKFSEATEIKDIKYLVKVSHGVLENKMYDYLQSKT
jgi:hypothetical protein